jgi:hypothetical protein
VIFLSNLTDFELQKLDWKGGFHLHSRKGRSVTQQIYKTDYIGLVLHSRCPLFVSEE